VPLIQVKLPIHYKIRICSSTGAVRKILPADMFAVHHDRP
jgi:hypothetical protein